MKNKFLITTVLFGALISFTACTDLELEETDSIFREDSGDGFSGVSDIPSALTNSYNSIRDQLNTQENLYALQEVTSDEMLVPTRGTDWGDNGLWRSLHQHTWDSNHQFLLNSWNNHNRNVFNLSELIAPESNANPQQLAEAKFLRAFSMFWVMDLFGQVPFREVTEGASVDPRIMTRSEAFDFVLNDLNEALPDLPTAGPGPETNFATKASAHFLLAKLYLNKHVYTGNAEASADDMNQVINHVDAIAGDGFGLQSGYFEIFEPDVDSETIWYTNTGVGSRIWNGLHYNQGAVGNDAGGWNGFTTLAEFYDLFEGPEDSNHPNVGQEERRGYVPLEGTSNNESEGFFAGGKDEDEDGYVDGSDIGLGFLYGQQHELDGSMTTDRQGDPLFYTKELPGLVGNPEETGIRVIKWHPSNGAYYEHMVLFRYADAHLMKAEAIMRGGTGENALDLVNELRVLRDATPLSSLTDQDMLDERGREMYNEMWRRQDLIRFNQFTDEWAHKPESEDFRVLFPIPNTALTSNPNLTQNEGY